MTRYELIAVGLAAWGAMLSTLLAVVRIWETRREGLRLSASYGFHSDPDEGNEVIVLNTSKLPVMVSYWELVWGHYSWGRFIIDEEEWKFPLTPEDMDFTVPPHSKHALRFVGGEHFEWGPSSSKRGKIYLRLHIVGRHRRVTLLVYDPDNK